MFVCFCACLYVTLWYVCVQASHCESSKEQIDSNVRDSKFHTRSDHQTDVTKKRNEKLEKVVSMSAIFFWFFFCPFAVAFSQAFSFALLL